MNKSHSREQQPNETGEVWSVIRNDDDDIFEVKSDSGEVIGMAIDRTKADRLAGLLNERSRISAAVEHFFAALRSLPDNTRMDLSFALPISNLRALTSSPSQSATDTTRQAKPDFNSPKWAAAVAEVTAVQEERRRLAGAPQTKTDEEIADKLILDLFHWGCNDRERKAILDAIREGRGGAATEEVLGER